jgi:AraC family transcriptional activator of pobA
MAWSAEKLDDPLDDDYGLKMSASAVPTFYLYGEPHRAVADGFIHVEHLDDRSRPSEWTIRPHAHTGLHHIFWIASGGGAMQAEARVFQFAAPALLVVPASVVHGFSWTSESTGSVLTLANGQLTELARRDPAIGKLFAAAHVIALEIDAARSTQLHMDTLMRELGWSAIGHQAAVEASLLSLAVIALRSRRADAEAAPVRPGQQAALVARFRERIENRYRQREPVAAHAAALGVSESALRAACTRSAGLSPALMLDERALLEARRLLLYSNMSVAQVAYSVGFTDPAYFSRFFSRRVGTSPRRYRSTAPDVPG